MTQDEITVLAGHRIVSPWVMKLCMDAAKAEREACAMVCWWLAAELDTDSKTAIRCTDAIRARGEA